MPAADNVVDVAAAVILRDDGAFLLGRRPSGKVYAGYWEFPGGKVEAGETPRHSLVRELDEELGIAVDTAYPWITREFVYPHAHVRLHFFRVTRWSGELRELQHDALSWQHADSITVTPLLPANAPVLSALMLPDFYAITHAAEIGVDAQLAALSQALERGCRLVQVREPKLSEADRARFAHAAAALCHKHGAHILVSADLELARASHSDGIHLPSSQLAALSLRPHLPLVGASCHNREELAQAARLQVDFVVLGPVLETASHPGKAGIGWDAFARMATGYPLPIYALGGLDAEDMRAAWNAGAHGIAAIRAAWD